MDSQLQGGRGICLYRLCDTILTLLFLYIFADKIRPFAWVFYENNTRLRDFQE